nr:MAG TPA: hypothetical protein [Caudoviricetes sp.]
MNLPNSQVAAISSKEGYVDVYQASVKEDKLLELEKMAKNLYPYMIAGNIKYVSIDLKYFDFKKVNYGSELDKTLLNELVDCYDFQKDVLKNSLESLHDQYGDPFIVSAYMNSIIEDGKRVIKIYFDFENWVEATINTGLILKV